MPFIRIMLGKSFDLYGKSPWVIRIEKVCRCLEHCRGISFTLNHNDKDNHPYPNHELTHEEVGELKFFIDEYFKDYESAKAYQEKAMQVQGMQK
jgi:hypothetical protein